MSIDAVGTTLRPRKRFLKARLVGLLRTGGKQPVGVLCTLVLLVVVVLAIFAQVIAPYSPIKLEGSRLEGPSARFLLGTDSTGRDVLSRVIFGARVSLLVGVISVGIGTVFGAVVGIASAYFMGKFDLITQRVIDGMMSFPPLLLALVMVSVLGPSLQNAMIAIGITLLPNQARVIRSGVLSIKEEQYIDAAKAIGASDARIMLRHIVPNVAPLVIILASVHVAGAIITEASLSFLGLGTQPPTASWGEMLSGPGRTHMESAPWIVLAPGVAISVTVLAFNLLGDTIRDIWDPRLRGSR